MGDEPSMPSQVGAVTRTASGREGRPLNLLALSLLALVIGAATGVGAAAFRWLIAFVHNLAFYGHLSFVYDANRLEPPSPWGPLVVLVPIIGGLIVVFLVRRYAPEAKGHGVPEVMDAVFYKSGQIRGRVAVIKSLASALSIGTGASVGREGPIVQIGSALGSTLARTRRSRFGAARDPDRRRRGCRHRRHLQYAAGRRHVRARASSAGG